MSRFVEPFRVISREVASRLAWFPGQLTGSYASSNGYNSATTAKKKLVVTP